MLAICLTVSPKASNVSSSPDVHSVSKSRAFFIDSLLDSCLRCTFGLHCNSFGSICLCFLKEYPHEHTIDFSHFHVDITTKSQQFFRNILIHQQSHHTYTHNSNYCNQA